MYVTPGIVGQPNASRGTTLVWKPGRGTASTAVLSARRGTALGGGSTFLLTHSSSATRSARSAGSLAFPFVNCCQAPRAL